jgi:transcriptional regulator with XRE-family HTH domain
MRFSEKLILLRKRKGMTQEEFSRAVGVSRQSVYKWESGQSYPEAAKLLEIRRLFGVSIDHLLDESIQLPFPTEYSTSYIYQEKQEKNTTTPVVTEKETILDTPNTPKEEPISKEPEMQPELKQEEIAQPGRVAPAPTAPKRSPVQIKRKMPSTLREIVGAFFGKRR